MRTLQPDHIEAPPRGGGGVHGEPVATWPAHSQLLTPPAAQDPAMNGRLQSESSPMLQQLSQQSLSRDLTELSRRSISNMEPSGTGTRERGDGRAAAGGRRTGVWCAVEGLGWGGVGGALDRGSLWPSFRRRGASPAPQTPWPLPFKSFCGLEK